MGSEEAWDECPTGRLLDSQTVQEAFSGKYAAAGRVRNDAVCWGVRAVVESGQRIWRSLGRNSN